MQEMKRLFAISREKHLHVQLVYCRIDMYLLTACMQFVFDSLSTEGRDAITDKISDHPEAF